RRPAAGGRAHEGRVREPPSPGDRGGAVVAQADHPVHRRGPHAGRRRARGRCRLVGRAGAAGTGDAANLLKPALARGKLRTIAATTWAEYKKHIEKDPALTQRFTVVQAP